MTEAPTRYGDPARGVTLGDVSHAADALLRAGARPTVEKIRAAIGSGSPNTVGPLLDAWWKRLAGRLDAGPAAFHRLPESVAHVAEALWMQALEEGRRRALLEQRMTDRALAQDKERVELRSHVLTLRESELETRLRDKDRTISELTARVDTLTAMLQKEQASHDSVSRRLSSVEAELSTTRQLNAAVGASRIKHRQAALRSIRLGKGSGAKRKLPTTPKKRRGQKSR
jgi:septal ring factor EnvC (AmiA/AmiB activator)